MVWVAVVVCLFLALTAGWFAWTAYLFMRSAEGAADRAHAPERRAEEMLLAWYRRQRKDGLCGCGGDEVADAGWVELPGHGEAN